MVTIVTNVLKPLIDTELTVVTILFYFKKIVTTVTIYYPSVTEFVTKQKIGNTFGYA
jgi:hypothetical protein